MEEFAIGEIAKEHILLSMAGWNGYAKMGNTYRLRAKVWNETREFLNNEQPK